MFSGGLDSTATLKLILTETKNEVIAHHISIRMWPPRWMPEDESSDKCLAYFKDHYRQFTVSKSLFSVDECPGRVNSVALVAALGALCARSFKANVVVTGHKKDDTLFASTPQEWQKRRDVESSFLNLLFPSACWTYPIIDWSKEQLKNYLEPELFKLTWSCRREWVDEKGHFVHCGRCFACQARGEPFYMGIPY